MAYSKEKSSNNDGNIIATTSAMAVAGEQREKERKREMVNSAQSVK